MRSLPVSYRCQSCGLGGYENVCLLDNGEQLCGRCLEWGLDRAIVLGLLPALQGVLCDPFEFAERLKEIHRDAVELRYPPSEFISLLGA